MPANGFDNSVLCLNSNWLDLTGGSPTVAESESFVSSSGDVSLWTAPYSSLREEYGRAAD